MAKKWATRSRNVFLHVCDIVFPFNNSHNTLKYSTTHLVGSLTLNIFEIKFQNLLAYCLK